MPNSVVITDIDRGFNQLKTLLYQLQKKPQGVVVGIIEPAAEQPKKTKTGWSYRSILEVAIFNEFGTDNIPARSFIREPFDRFGGYFKLHQSLIDRVVSGRITLQSALDILGSSIVKSFQKNIEKGILPENALSTISHKGSDTPLIDTGELHDTINYRVE